ncbi:MAG TPA: PrsW family glutamic-type intramembrane protease [Thermoanaerobaculia bacterium]
MAAGMNGGWITPTLEIALALVPVVLFLASLVWLDSYKLVTLRGVLQMLAAGALAAAASWVVNHAIGAEMDPGLVRRWVAPLVEETIKAVPLLLLLRRGRVGFLVDAVIFGYAIGTGFALIENIYYLWAFPGSSPLLWLIRGVGTAVMHGATTAMLALATVALQGRRQSDSLALALPGLAGAILLHSAFNHFVIPPLFSAILMMLVLPPLLVLVFAQSERYLRDWLGTGFDLDSDLLRLMQAGDFESSQPGRYLASLRARFDGTTVADMLCYLKLQAELSLQAKGLLMLRETGFETRKDPAVRGKLEELRFLESSIGKTGFLALRPVLRTTRHDVWERHLLMD